MTHEILIDFKNFKVIFSLEHELYQYIISSIQIKKIKHKI